MVATLWISRKARTVSKTEVSLGRQDEGYERFESTLLSQTIVRIVAAVFKNGSKIIPRGLREVVYKRIDRTNYRPTPETDGTVASFDLIRAAVNLMVAAALIAWATSLKLPLSTTYVTFMVAMGTSLSDQAWGRDSAVYRVTGVLTVIGGWFFTAMMAFSVSSIFAVAIYYGGAPIVIAILVLAVLLIIRTHLAHRFRLRAEEAAEVFNLRKITNSGAALNVTFEHAGIFLREVGQVLADGLEGLFEQDRQKLRVARQGERQIQQWSNIIVANIFKVLRLLQWDEVANTQRYAQTISTLQEISESTRDIVIRGKVHVANNHAGLLDEQIEELRRIKRRVMQILEHASEALLQRERPDREEFKAAVQRLRTLTHEFDQNQIKRIQDNTSKTRLSILFYAFMWDCLKIAEQTNHLLKIFRDPLRPAASLDHNGDPVAPPQAGTGPDPDENPVTDTVDA
jgi:Na+/phosphate symporter